MAIAEILGEAPVSDRLALELSAVVVAVADEEPRVLTVSDGHALPSGPLEPEHRTLERGLRNWVEALTGLPLGYVEQLYTFADRGRAQADQSNRVISLSYLALTRDARTSALAGVGWHNWYRYFPWEDWRGGRNSLVGDVVLPRLLAWVAAVDGEARELRRQRVTLTFGEAGRPWDEDLVLQRFELLYEAGLVEEAARSRTVDPGGPIPGDAMEHDHRRILATGIARLRAKIKYRPVVFELMPDTYTLLQLQRTVEALGGVRLHKQNFRRFIEGQQLVEETGTFASATGGRPAKLFRFRRKVLQQRAVTGTKMPLVKPA